MHPRLQAELSVEARSTVWRTPNATWTVTTAKELIALDPGLNAVARFPLPTDWPGTHAVTPGGTGAALSLADRVTLIDQAGQPRWEVTHAPWADGESGSTWVTPDGLVWAVVPGQDGAESPDRWWVLDAATGRLLHDLALGGRSCGSDPIGHVGGVLLGLTAAGDNGGFRICAATFEPGGRSPDHLRGDGDGEGDGEGDAPTLILMPGTERVLADVHRSGERYLTTDRDHENVAVHSLADGTVLVDRAAEDIFGPDDFVDFHAAFVTDDHIVVRSVLDQQHIVLDATQLEVIGPVEYPDGAARDAVLPAGNGSWVTTDWLDGRVQLWTL